MPRFWIYRLNEWFSFWFHELNLTQSEKLRWHCIGIKIKLNFQASMPSKPILSSWVQKLCYWHMHCGSFHMKIWCWNVDMIFLYPGCSIRHEFDWMRSERKPQYSEWKPGPKVTLTYRRIWSGKLKTAWLCLPVQNWSKLFAIVSGLCFFKYQIV